MVDFDFTGRINKPSFFFMFRIVEYILRRDFHILCLILCINQWFVELEQLLEAFGFGFLSHSSISDGHILLLKVVDRLFFRSYGRFSYLLIIFCVVFSKARLVLLVLLSFFLKWLLDWIFDIKGIPPLLLQILSPAHVLPNLIGNAPKATIIIIWIIELIPDQF